MANPSAQQSGPTVVARSALLTLTAAPSDHALRLQVSRIPDHRLIAGPGSVTVTLDGHSVPVTAQADGSYLISTSAQSGGAHSLGVIVSHDGIRELLTGSVTVPQRRSALDVLQGHGMFAWWVLNIAVVLIAVIVISRRRG
ncbi:MAG TPA: hypothetical protein VHY36_00600 [Steroidobacteraceae bacterium]|jgi:hypothetical protein|nr:hypothetical protein [Steroidobacteraceae bacterium]